MAGQRAKEDCIQGLLCRYWMRCPAGRNVAKCLRLLSRADFQGIDFDPEEVG